MQTFYSGAHSIIFCPVNTFSDANESTMPDYAHNFGGKHTWQDWGLVPLSRPYVAPPEPKTNTLEINGANGVVDLTEVPLGFPVYKNRTGTWDFAMAHDRIDLDPVPNHPGALSDYAWDRQLAVIMGYLHGRTVCVVLTDDPSYYYSGRVTVSQISADTMYTKITLSYDLYPYKRMVWTTLGNWEWNPFDFVYGQVTQNIFKNLRLDSDSASSQLIVGGNPHGITPDIAGDEPVMPTIIFESDDTTSCSMSINNVGYEAAGARRFTIPDGVTTNRQIMIVCPYPDDICYMSFYSGHGNISIKFRPGRL